MRRFPFAQALGLALIPVLLPHLEAPGAEILLEGFENVAKLRPVGKVTVVSGADAVTEGKSALQLFPGSAVQVRIRPRLVKRPGWLKIDTFEGQPVLACLELALTGSTTRAGWVLPGKDALAIPLSVPAGAARLPWPGRPLTLSVRNRGRHSVVLDNVRLVEPVAAPAGAVLLDFGPERQELWPGFERAELEARGVSWSGQARIFSFSTPFPDPLLGDFAGRLPGFKVSEAVTVRASGEPNLAWIWVTHYGQQYSPSLEYMVKLNGKVQLRRRVEPSQMFSREGLLSGKGEPWTTEWFESTFVPRVVSKLQCPLKDGDNRLLLANCQLAAMITAPRARQAEMREYVQGLEEDLKRYRRQFVLATRQLPRCEVVPSKEQRQAGLMIFVPPPDERFVGRYVPRPEHRGKSLKMVVASGSAGLAAVTVVPCRPARLLQASMEILRDPNKGAIPVTGCRVHALEPVAVVENAAVYHQPYLPARSFRSVRERGVYWFAVQVEVPQRARTGRYRSAIRVTMDQSGAKLPVEVEVRNIGPAPAGGEGTFGVMGPISCAQAYGSLAEAIPPPRRVQLTRDILGRLAAAGFNASLVSGPALGGDYAPATGPMAAALKERLRIPGSGQSLVSMASALRDMRSVQPGTDRHQRLVADVVRETDKVAGKFGMTNFALYCGHVSRATDLPGAAKVARAMRKAGGTPALSMGGVVLASARTEDLAELSDLLGTLLVTGARGLRGPVEAFKRSSSRRALLLRAYFPDAYAYGFYCWGIGADGAYAHQAFSSAPLFNPFWFDGRTLLVPNAARGFEPTLSLLLVGEGMADYHLARRCEAIVAQAKKRKASAKGLEAVLTEIRTAADGASLGFDRSCLRSRQVSPAKLVQWREALIREANKLVEPPASKPS